MKPRILIVEDEPAIAETIQYALETEGFDVCCSSSGACVPAMLAENDIALVVLDIGLPDVSGLELCKEIRKNHDIPIIFLTARGEEVDRVVGLEIGGDDYVTKPFSPRELTARVRAVLRRMKPSGGDGARASKAFRVDEGRRCITYFGAILDLSRYEYLLLRTFIRRPGQVFTRDRLMELVWDEPDSSLDRTIDVHIKNIRAKLKAVKHDEDPIVTHRGTGYALREDL